MRGKLRFIVALLCAAGAVLACIAYADSARAQVIRERDAALERYGGELVTLVVSNVALETGDIVSHTNVSEREWLADLAPEDALTSIDEVIGKTVSIPLAKGAPITQLTFRDEAHVLDVPSGHVALAIPASDRLGVSEAMGIGSKVIAYETGTDSAHVLAHDVTILGMPTQQTSLSSAASITLAVLAEDVQSILVASSNANLRLVMPADDLDFIPENSDSREDSTERVEPVDGGEHSEKGNAL
ncbi:MAG: hypothetical protein IJ125_08620 [Atopobiaceae bacterium]|nr:hypothetical protein [Atopobiaceae bacterium]